jgi:multidrug efflux system outer membrane protein
MWNYRKKHFNLAGLSPLLDVRQAELNLATTESDIPVFRFQLDQAINRIGVLLGDYPSALQAELSEPAQIPEPPEDIAIGLPAELLRQRPDIRQAEREIAAQTAQIGVATAELYPQFSIFGTFALQAVDSVKFFTGQNFAGSIGPQFRWRIFEGGRLRDNIRIQEAITEELLYNYENTVLGALEEVENAMVSYVQDVDRKKSLEESVKAAESAVELVETLYKTGLTDFQNVLDTQRSLFQQQDQLAQSRGNIVQDLIGLYRALGGGWSPEPENELFTYNIQEDARNLASEKSDGIDVKNTQNELK